MRKSNGAGTIYKRGEIWWVKIHVDGRPVYRSSESTKQGDAVKLRDQLIAKKVRGEVTGGKADKVLIGELLDDVLNSDISESTRNIWRYVIEGNSTTPTKDGKPRKKITYGHLRPFFGNIRAARLTTDKMDEYREKRLKEGVIDATVNRELAILRTAMHNARKRTPPKVLIIPYFPMVAENNVRKGFMPDDDYIKMRDALPSEIRPLFVVAYNTGIRRGALIGIKWDQVDFDEGYIYIAADEMKGREAITVPIFEGDMRDLLLAAKQERDKLWPDSPWVFNRSGKPIKDTREVWDRSIVKAGINRLTLHDMRRTAVRNMRRANIPQVIRMKISGHKTDSMERRYNIVDGDDLAVAKKFMEARQQIAKSAEQL